jgi:RHH-type proline utilization regulon transcriptional repressor/proline dehydrogenase/delta 1-pyrroline-5-carboxylate dehydrogenase
VPFIAPSEIQNTKLSAALRGYDREETDTLLTQIKASYERVWAAEFSREHDHFRLIGQDNVRRYLPVEA